MSVPPFLLKYISRVLPQPILWLTQITWCPHILLLFCRKMERLVLIPVCHGLRVINKWNQDLMERIVLVTFVHNFQLLLFYISLVKNLNFPFSVARSWQKQLECFSEPLHIYIYITLIYFILHGYRSSFWQHAYLWKYMFEHWCSESLPGSQSTFCLCFVFKVEKVLFVFGLIQFPVPPCFRTTLFGNTSVFLSGLSSGSFFCLFLLLWFSFSLTLWL